VQIGPVAHPASCAMGTGSFPEVKRPGHGIDHPPPSSAEVKERVELNLYSLSGAFMAGYNNNNNNNIYLTAIGFSPGGSRF